jgi:hypothetical protein
VTYFRLVGFCDGPLGCVVGWDTVLQGGRSRVQFVSVLNKLSTTSWGNMGEWLYRSAYS